MQQRENERQSLESGFSFVLPFSVCDDGTANTRTRATRGETSNVRTYDKHTARSDGPRQFPTNNRARCASAGERAYIIGFLQHFALLHERQQARRVRRGMAQCRRRF